MPVYFRFVGISVAHEHEVHVVVDVEPIDVVGIAFEQFVECVFGGGDVFQLVFQDDSHVEQAFLYDVVGVNNFLFGFRDLHQIVFRIVGVLFPSKLFFVFLDFGNLFVRQGIAQRIGQFFRFVFAVVGFCVEIRHGECGFVDAPPIVFQLSASPTALEFGFSGVFSGGVVEIP